jgi:hypothetical protein
MEILQWLCLGIAVAQLIFIYHIMVNIGHLGLEYTLLRQKQEYLEKALETNSIKNQTYYEILAQKEYNNENYQELNTSLHREYVKKIEEIKALLKK